MKQIMVLMAGMLIVTAPCWADSGEERPLTAAEQAFFKNTYQKAMALMPTAPDGWTTQREELSMPAKVGVGAENHPIFFDIFCSYQKPAAMDLTSMEANGKSMEDLGARLSSLGEKMNEAMARGDQAALAKIQKEMQEAMNSNTGMQKMKATADEQKHNSAKIRIRINAHGADYSFVKEITPKAPAIHALRTVRSSQPSPSDGLDTTMLFFGTYKKKKSGDTFQIYQTSDAGPGAKIHRLILEIEADEKIVEELLAKMNLKELAALIQ
jgi:hypothetical protein